MRNRPLKIALGLLCVAAAAATVAAGGKRKHTLTGRIVAFRWADRTFQTVSFVQNREEFVVEDAHREKRGRPRLVKVIYLHFGYSEITKAMLDGNKLLKMRVQRDRGCDETYEHFISSAPVIKTVDLNGVPVQAPQTPPVVFLGGFDGSELVTGTKLECFKMEKGNFQVIEHEGR